MNIPSKANFEILATATLYKEKFGSAFIVFVGGLASFAHYDVGAARHQAREYVKQNKFDVRIRAVKL